MGSDRSGTVKVPEVDENTSLLPELERRKSLVEKVSWKPITRVLLCGFLVSLSFAVTQVPLTYVFRLMTCEAYYESHDNPPPGHDRCSVREIEAGTARAVSLLGCSTTFFGVANLFITGSYIKRFGVKSTLALQVFWPGVRLAVQNVGVAVGGSTGIIIVQCSQIITIIGGPAGYLLALNTYVADLVDNKERTGYLGILQGCNFFGSAIGILAGGLLADAFSIQTPFQVTLGLFLASTLFVLLFLPWVAPPKAELIAAKNGPWYIRAFGPLKSILPAKWELQSGRIQREYGPLILSAGVFSAVLATGFIPTMLQLYATDIFGFGTTQNSLMISAHLFLRGLFLTLGFPRIISLGRQILEKRRTAQLQAAAIKPQHDDANTSLMTAEGDIATAVQEEAGTDVPPPQRTDDQETYDFDLIYTRFSLLVDGLLTFLATFITQGWQMYVLAAFLPLGAGTSSAAKGTILQMCPAAERTDALSAISLVEMIARLSTTFVFGLVFAAFASIGKTYFVFVCNAGVALVGFGIMWFCCFPPEGSIRVDMSGANTRTESEENGSTA